MIVRNGLPPVLNRPSVFRAIPTAPLAPVGFTPPGTIGTTTTALTAGGDAGFHPVQDWSGVPRLDQGSQNSCGTTSLAMIMQYLTGQPIDQSEIDNAIRRTNLWGTAPSDIKRFAEDKGIPTGMYNNSTMAELKSHVAAGRGVMVSIDDPYSNGADGGFKEHYVIVTGFEMKNGQEFVRIRDPNGDNNPNAGRLGGNGDYLMPRAEFEKKWGKTLDGYDNFMMVFGKKGESLPADRLDGMEHSVAMAESYRNLANNVDRILSPEDFPTFVHGVIGAPGALVFGIPTAVGWGVSFVGKQLRELSEKLPFGLREAGIALATPIDAAGILVSRIGAGFSSAWDRLGGAGEALLRGDLKGFGKGIFNAGKEAVMGVVNGVVDAGKTIVKGVKDIGKGVVNAVKDVGSAIGKGIKKIFSGW